MGETCATCTHFIGSGDWGLCCDLKYDLCYSCTPKCNESIIRQRPKRLPQRRGLRLAPFFCMR